MFSNNYLNILDSIKKITKLCKDAEMWGHIREVYDLLVRWMAIKMYAGHCGIVAIAEGFVCGLLPVLLSILLKNSSSSTGGGNRRSNLVFTDVHIEEIFLLLRDFIMCVHGGGGKDQYERSLA